MMEDNKDNKRLNGLRDRHVAQIIRRKMIQKHHGDKNKYSRKQKHKNDEQE